MGDSEFNETCDQLKKCQIRAEGDPIEIGTHLNWSGPSLITHILPPPDYPHNRLTSPNPLRPFHAILIDPQEGVDARSWSITFVEPLKAGTWQYSQVWRVEASSTQDPGKKIPLVVKLFQASLFPIREDASQMNSRTWYSSAELIANEMNSYYRARDAQGTDIPLCYGFYTFRLPSEEEAFGVVLEDLLDKRQGIPLDKFFEREAKASRLTFETMDRVHCAALSLQNRLHDLGLAHVLFRLDQIVALRSSSTGDIDQSPILVGFGFSKSSSKEKVVSLYEKGNSNSPRWRWRWNQVDQQKLFGAISIVLGPIDEKWEELEREWRRVERERKRLGFLCMHEEIQVPREVKADMVDDEEEEETERDRRDRKELHMLLGGSLGDLR
ncbi:uncharacterized protein JCM6883_003012 [Sporobolomyces salmoneus]|uniref:uncharacterized protein n=1 Tax=Sporobolomyces salmoneus TaxID=183962 RepID=UPI0031746067